MSVAGFGSSVSSLRRRFCLRRKSVLRALLTLVAVAVCGRLTYQGYVMLVSTLFDEDCSQDQEGPRQLVQRLCELYRRGKIAGDMCPPLCDVEQIHFSGCAAVFSQKTVIPVSCDGVCRKGRSVPAYLKLCHKDINVEDIEARKDRYTDQDLNDFSNTLTFLLFSRVGEFINRLPFNDSDMLKVIWGQDYKGHVIGTQEANAVWRSLALLLRQKEFVFGRAFGHLRLFPEIYGSCGPMYLQESCTPNPWLRWNPSGRRKQVSRRPELPWSERAAYAVKVLESIQKLQTFLPEPLFLCDIKGDQFGASEDGSLRVLDLDDAWFKFSTARLLITKCRKDGHCKFHQCRGICDVTRGRCFLHDNYTLQATCRAVFLNHWSFSYGVDIGGLLNDPPSSLAADLQRVLLSCTSILTYLKQREQGASGGHVIHNFVKVLNTSLHQHNL